MIIDHDIDKSRRVALSFFQISRLIDRLPLHLLEVNVATRVDNIAASNEVNVTVRAENDSVAPVELDSSDLNLTLLNRAIFSGLRLHFFIINLFLG